MSTDDEPEDWWAKNLLNYSKDGTSGSWEHQLCVTTDKEVCIDFHQFFETINKIESVQDNPKYNTPAANTDGMYGNEKV